MNKEVKSKNCTLKYATEVGDKISLVNIVQVVWYELLQKLIIDTLC